MRRTSQPHIDLARHGANKLRRKAGIVAGLVAILIVAWIAVALLRSPPAPRLLLTIPTTSMISGAPLALRPSFGAQEAVAVGGIGTIAVSGEETPIPIASLTKIMSALVVLHDHPLSPGEDGPNITVTNADVAAYRLERSEGDSVVAVQAGEQLSEFQALEAALIPSGDNVIELLASWDARSTSAFVAKMNAEAHKLGLEHTHYTEPSGVDPANVSTAADQLRLAEVAIANPVFANIVAMAQVSLPVAGVQYNVDADLGIDGIDGIKTGWVPQGGGCFVFSARHAVDGTDVSVLGAVIGEQSMTPLPTALSVAKQLVVSAEKTLHVFRLARGATVGTLSVPYAPPVRVVTTSSVSLIGWSGAHVRFNPRTVRSLPDAVSTGSRVGSLVARLDETHQSTALMTAGRLRGPSLGWRLAHL